MNFKKIIMGTAAGALMFGSLAASAFATGPTCTVPGSYSTIQAAVNDSSCTTINVASGTYAENVSIDHAVVLNGPNAGTSGNGSRGSEATLQSVNITASNVTVDGFSFNNAGVQMNINGSSTLSGVKVQNNIFSGYGSVGFPAYNAGNLLITRNLFENPVSNTESIQIKSDSSHIGGCNGTVVSNNVFTAASNNGGADINFSCTESNSTGVTVSGNTDTGLSDANYTSFTAFSGVTGDISVTNNNVTGTPTSGSPVFFFGGVSGSVSITGNTLVDDGSSAIAIIGGDYTSDGPNTGTFTITHNDLSGNTHGIYVSADAFNSGAKVIANRNNLAGDTVYGIQNVNSANIVADGTCNWWGNVSGPGPVGSGTGSNVSSNVTYSPWLTTTDLNGPCNGPFITTPVITTPANNSTVTVSNMVKVDWDASTGSNPPFQYQYQAFSDPGYTNSIYQSGWLTASEIPTPGTPPGVYYLTVKAKDANGTETAWSNGSGNPYKVTVIADVTPTPTPINAFLVPAQCNQDISYHLIKGTSKAETINGTSGNDLIYGNGGADKIDGKGGDDCIVGGNGADTLSGSDGNDVLIGGDGADTLNGGAGNDKLYGQGGADVMNGDAGDDTLDGGAAADRANGGAGQDTCIAESKNSCEQ